jgi:hypothetical protein
MTHEFEVRLDGPKAHLGEVPAADVAKLLVGVERVLAHASAYLVNRPIKSRGRREQLVVDASRVALVGVREGSVVPVFAIPDVAPPVGFALDAAPLGEHALRAALRAATNVSEAPAEVAGALAQLGRDLDIGTVYASLEFRYTNGGPEQRVTIDGAAVARLEERAQSAPRLRSGDIQGVLVEADFEALRGHIRTSEGKRVTLEYGNELADDIEEAIRERRDFVGEVVYDATGETIESVRLTAIERQSPLWPGLEPGEFWVHRSIDDLMVAQSATASADIASLTIDASDAEAEAFLEALGL